MDIEENLSRKTRFFIEKDQFVLVIGNQGKNIQALEDTLNVEVYINRTNGQVTITGTRCEEAKKIIQENLSNVTSFSIGKEYRRLVLESISALEDAHNVKINSFEDGKVEIIGNNQIKCEAVKMAIKSMMERPYEEKFSISAKLMSFVAGKNGWNVKNIENTYGVHIFLPEDKYGTEITIKGSSSNSVAAAKEIIQASIAYKMGFIIEKDYCHLVIGQKGKTIVALSDKLNVSINVQEDGRVLLTGKQREDTEAGKKAIELLIEELKSHELHQEKFSVPACVMGYILGPNGSNRDKIESNYNVHLCLPLAYDKPEITVKGSDAKNVKAAKTHILENVETSLEVNKGCVGKIIGPGGCVIRRLNQEYGIVIKFEDEVKGKITRKAYVLGAKKHATAARQAIIAMIKD